MRDLKSREQALGSSFLGADEPNSTPRSQPIARRALYSYGEEMRNGDLLADEEHVYGA